MTESDSVKIDESNPLAALRLFGLLACLVLALLFIADGIERGFREDTFLYAVAFSAFSIALVIPYLPSIGRFFKRLFWIGVAGLLLWGVWSFISGLPSMSFTSFLLLLIVLQLAEGDKKK